MWKSEFTPSLLRDLENSDLVSEIVLIDNNQSEISVDLTTFLKIKYMPQEENIYVNPAWNLGVEVASNELLCICNDDLIFDVDLYLNKVLEHKDRLGVFGSNYRDRFNYKKRDRLIPLTSDLQKKAAIVGNGFGMMMFLKKENWVPIPNQLKIYYGDNWIIGSHPKTSYSLEPFKMFKTKPHTTSISKDLRKILDKDTKAWKSLVSIYKNF